MAAMKPMFILFRDNFLMGFAGYINGIDYFNEYYTSYKAIQTLRYKLRRLYYKLDHHSIKNVAMMLKY